GLIDPATYGVYLPGGGTITNVLGGTIVGNMSGIVIKGGAGTVSNAGSIIGGTYAVQFASGFANRLIIDSVAYFNGTVDGGNSIGSGVASTLELTSAAGAGTLNSLGSHFIDFANITVDVGAVWTLAYDTIASGYTIAVDGTLTNVGDLGSGVTLD